MFRAIFLQIGAAIIAAAGAGAIVGFRGLMSAGLAGLACVVPNLLFALRLKMVSMRGEGASYAANFFIGEFLKVAATIGLLAIAIKGYPEMHWPSLLVSLAVVMHAGFLAFWKKN